MDTDGHGSKAKKECPSCQIRKRYGEAKLRGWIPGLKEKLDALRKKGFRLKDRDYRAVLAKFDEL